MSLLFNAPSRFVIAFLPRSKHLFILWLQSLSTVIFEPRKIKSATVFNFSPSICHEVVGPDAMVLVFYMLSFKPAFSLPSFTLIRRLFSSSLLSTIRAYIFCVSTELDLWNTVLVTVHCAWLLITASVSLLGFDCFFSCYIPCFLYMLGNFWLNTRV